MLNGRTVLFGILCILFVAAAFGQEPSDSHIITVTKQIDVAKLNENVDKLNGNVKTLTDTLEKLNGNVETLTKTVEDLEKSVVRIDERTKGILGWQYAIFGVMGAIFASMVVFFLTQRIPRKNEGETTSTSTAKAIESDTASTQAAQENQSETASTSTSPSGVPSDRKELKELLKSYSPATKEKV